MIHTADDSYESEMDHLNNNPIQDDFAAINKTGNKPVEEPEKKPSLGGDIDLNLGADLSGARGDVASVRSLDVPDTLHNNMQDIMRQHHIEDILSPTQPTGPYDRAIVPGGRIPDPQRGYGTGRDVRISQNEPDYDMDAWQKANPGVQMGPGQHYPDTYKLPNHPTFSDESQYHGKNGAEGGHWEQNPDKTYTFTPGKSNLEHFSPGQLQDYFNRVEPGNKLNLPAPEVNTDHSVKSGAVASKNSNTVYIDPSIPKEYHPFLAEHEVTEKYLMGKGVPYKDAHVVATLAEKQMVEQSGMNWDKYTDEVDPLVAKAEKGKGENPPPDPHVNIEDAIGHHADKASTLENADIKIGDASKPGGTTRPIDPEVQQILDQNKFRNLLQYYMGKKTAGVSNTSGSTTPQPESQGT